MIGTINPIVYRISGATPKPLSWLTASSIYTLGSLVGGLVTSAFLAAAGSLLLMVINSWHI